VRKIDVFVFVAVIFCLVMYGITWILQFCLLATELIQKGEWNRELVQNMGIGSLFFIFFLNEALGRLSSRRSRDK